MRALVIYAMKEIPHDVPEEFQLLPYGKIEIENDTPVLLDEQAMDNIIVNFIRRGNDMVIDYEHQTLDGTEAPAAGWREKQSIPVISFKACSKYS